MNLLETVATIVPMSEGAIKAIASISTKRQVSKNEFLLEEGQVCDYLYFVNSGSVRGLTNRDGTIITYWFALEGAFATSFGSFISRTPSKEAISSIEECSLTCIHYYDLAKLYDQYHEVERIGRIIGQKYYVHLEDRIYNLQFLSAKARYEHLISSFPTLLQRVPLGYIASYLGISQETLSRIRAKF